jgi:Do/DeqQ family serine protease
MNSIGMGDDNVIYRFLILILVLLTTGTSAAWAQAKVPQSKSEITLSFAPLVKEAAPAVVNIYARRIVESQSNPFHVSPIFENFFQDFGNIQPKVQNSLGSGVILSDDGIVVSNYHVVGGATDIRVVLNDGREFSARALIADRESDLAVIKLDSARNMPFLGFRDDKTVEVGELVLAIGNPFGIGQTVSSGIVSGLARSGTALSDGRGYFIQTDAPINPGNSGGALIDVAGRLIGVNTAILTRSGGSNGIGFAIPASLVKQFVLQAEAGFREFQRPWSGLIGRTLGGDIADSLGLQTRKGLVITAIHPRSSFLVAGFEVGDVITAIDGNSVATPAELLYRMSVAGLGADAMISRLTKDGPSDLMVRLGGAPDDPPQKRVVFDSESYFPRLMISSINPAVQAELGLAWDVEGFVVLDPGRFAGRIGLRAGDILQAANNEIFRSASELNEILKKNGHAGSLIIQRGTQRINLRFRK